MCRQKWSVLCFLSGPTKIAAKAKNPDHHVHLHLPQGPHRSSTVPHHSRPLSLPASLHRPLHFFSPHAGNPGCNERSITNRFCAFSARHSSTSFVNESGSLKEATSQSPPAAIQRLYHMGVLANPIARALHGLCVAVLAYLETHRRLKHVGPTPTFDSFAHCTTLPRAKAHPCAPCRPRAA